MPWYAKQLGGYNRDTTEAIANATMIVNALQNRGFSLLSACAILGNIGNEGGYNPWRWQIYNGQENCPTVSQFENWSVAEARLHGYGLFQYTPANKYINSSNQSYYFNVGYAPNFSDSAGDPSDGNAQLQYMADNFDGTYSDINTQIGQIRYQNYNPYFQALTPPIDILPWFNISSGEFITGHYFNSSTDIPLSDLTGAFELCWEGTGYSGATAGYFIRADNAEYWWNYFNDNPPGPGPGPEPPGPPVPPPTSRRKTPFWVLINPKLFL